MHSGDHSPSRSTTGWGLPWDLRAQGLAVSRCLKQEWWQATNTSLKHRLPPQHAGQCYSVQAMQPQVNAGESCGMDTPSAMMSTRGGPSCGGSDPRRASRANTSSDASHVSARWPARRDCVQPELTSSWCCHAPPQSADISGMCAYICKRPSPTARRQAWEVKGRQL